MQSLCSALHDSGVATASSPLPASQWQHHTSSGLSLHDAFADAARAAPHTAMLHCEGRVDPSRGLLVQLVDGALVTEWVGRLVPAVGHAWYQLRVDLLPQLLEARAEGLAFLEQHVPLAQPELDVAR